jgi:3-oxoacyl-[acyl-carrier protein] reductase
MRSEDGVDGRVALVTGGAGGLGAACAVELAQRGAAVAVLDRDAGAARSAVAALPDPGGAHLAVAADVASRAEIRDAVAAVSAQLGAPTLLVNAAGVLFPTRFDDITDEEWDLTFAVSAKGSFLCAQACLPGMREAGFGRVVNFSSTAGKSVSTVGGAHYTAAKAAVLGLTRALAAEVAGAGITVNAVCPGLFDTAMVRATTGEEDRARYARGFPVGRLGRPEEVAALVAFLCGTDAGYITGAALDINGGDLMV